MDGYHVSHDPAKPSTKEPTTGRTLNILDVPAASGKTAAPAKRESIAKGRALSPSKIAHPKPSKPYASRQVREADYSHSPDLDDLTEQLEAASLHKMGAIRDISPPSSVGGSDISSRASGVSSPSSLSSLSDASTSSSCRCNRWGVTRKGDRVKLDCGGSRCGYSDDDSSSGCSSDSESEDEVRPSRARAPVRASRR